MRSVNDCPDTIQNKTNTGSRTLGHFPTAVDYKRFNVFPGYVAFRRSVKDILQDIFMFPHILIVFPQRQK